MWNVLGFECKGIRKFCFAYNFIQFCDEFVRICYKFVLISREFLENAVFLKKN